MTHEIGSVNSLREALVEVRLSTGEAIECVVDTGFDGGLMLPCAFIEQIPFSVIGRLAFDLAGGTRLFAQVGLATVDWLDETREIEVIVSESTDALIGTELLQNTILTIDYLSSTVTISTSV